MEFISVKVLLVLGILLFLIRMPTYAEETLQYELTNDQISRVCVSETKNRLYVVTIELNGSDKKALSRLTENNIGKRLDVIFLGRILVSAIIKDKIDSGLIGLAESDLEEATKTISEILKK